MHKKAVHCLDGKPSLLASPTVIVTIKPIDVRPHHFHRSPNIGRAIARTAGTIDVRGDRNTGALITRMTTGGRRVGIAAPVTVVRLRAGMATICI